MDDFLSVVVALTYFYIYDSFIRRGLYETARAFRLQVPTPALFQTPLSPTNPLSLIDDEEVSSDNSTNWRQINYATDQSEWEALQDDADSSYKDEYNMWAMWQQSGLMPSIHQESTESNEQMVEERILDDIFGTDNQEPVPNESCVKVKDGGKKCKEGCSYSQDAYLYDSSTFTLGNEDDNAISGFSFDGYHEAPYNDEIQGVTVGGNLVLQTTPNPERLMLSSTPASIEDTCTLGTHFVAQTVPRISENASNEHVDGGINMQGGNNSDSEIWFPIPVHLKKLPKHCFWLDNEEGASCSRDAYLHDYSLNGKRKEDITVFPPGNLYEHHESSMNDDLKGVTVGGKFVPEIMPNTENPIMCLLAPNLDVSYCYSRVPESSGMKRKWFEEFGDGGDFSTRNSHLFGSSSGKGNDADGVSFGTGSHQSNAYPD